MKVFPRNFSGYICLSYWLNHFTVFVRDEIYTYEEGAEQTKTFFDVRKLIRMENFHFDF